MEGPGPRPLTTRSINLGSADLTGVVLDGAVWNEETAWPENHG